MTTTTNDGPVGATVKRVASGAHDAVDRIADATTGAAENLSIKGEQVSDAQEKWFETVREYVHENPLKSLGMAVAGGYLLSKIMSARRPVSQHVPRT